MLLMRFVAPSAFSQSSQHELSTYHILINGADFDLRAQPWACAVAEQKQYSL